MNVAIFTDSFPPNVDGVSRCSLGYANAISEENYGKVIVVSPRKPGVKYDYPFPVYCFNSLSTGYHEFRAGHPFIPKLILEMKKLNIDIIHSHSPFIAMTSARQVRQFLKIPIVFTQHTKWDYDLARAIPVKTIARSLERFAYNNINAADEVWAVSQGAGKYLQQRGYKGDYFVMPNGTDFPKGNVNEAFLRELKIKYNLVDNVPVMLFVGRMMWYKGIGLIIDALEMLKNRGFNFRMIFVGDGEDLQRAENSVNEKNLGDLIFFAGRVNDREKLRAFYTCSDLFVFPSTYDTAGLVVLEAAACSCPSLVVRGSAAAEIITDDFNGYLCEQTPHSLADSIHKVLNDSDKHKAVSHRASEELYVPWSKIVERSMERYKRVKDNYDRFEGSKFKIF